mmetsp:Transcript_6698/g.10116  ORF Transcript_6698/g.10116 Transcript_6698/m.10116 type:complete len:232 (+) Transcript_6698:106-801(+)
MRNRNTRCLSYSKCYNKNCTFQHDSDHQPCRYGNKCPNGYDKTFTPCPCNHPPTCRNDGRCSKAKCIYRHNRANTNRDNRESWGQFFRSQVMRIVDLVGSLYEPTYATIAHIPGSLRLVSGIFSTLVSIPLGNLIVLVIALQSVYYVDYIPSLFAGIYKIILGVQDNTFGFLHAIIDKVHIIERVVLKVIHVVPGCLAILIIWKIFSRPSSVDIKHEETILNSEKRSIQSK